MKQPKSLSELIELAIRRHETSGLGLSSLAANNGHQLTATTINQIRQGLYKSRPRPATLRAIAWLAGVGDEVAFMAAGQPVPGPPFSEELPPGVDNLPPKARKVAIDMLRVLVDMNQDATNAGNTTDQEQPSHQRGSGDHASNARIGQKTKPLTDEHENVTPSGNDALDRLHQSKFDLAAKPAHGGISHDQDPDET